MKLGNFEAKETENIWLGYHAPLKLDIRSPFVKDIELENDFISDTIIVQTFFYFTSNLIDSYEKYPESVVSGLTKVGGILALVRIVQLALFYLHRYLFEAHVKK